MPRSKGSKSSKKSNKQPIQKITPIHQPDRNGLKDKEETGEAYSLLNNKRLLNKYRDEISSEEDEFDKDYSPRPQNPDNTSTALAYQPNYNTFISPGQKNIGKLVSYLDSDSDSSFYSNSRSGNPYLPFNGSKADTQSYSKNSSTTTDQNLSAEAKAKQAAKQTLEAKYKHQLQSQLVQTYYSVLLAKELQKKALDSGVRFNEVYECLPDDYTTEIIQNIKDNVRELTKHPVTTLNAKAIWNLNRIQETFGDEFKDRLEFERKTRQNEIEEKRKTTSEKLKKSLGKKKDSKPDMYNDHFGSQARHDLYRSFESQRQEFSQKIDTLEKTSETLKRQNGLLESQQRTSWDSIKQERKKYIDQRSKGYQNGRTSPVERIGDFQNIDENINLFKREDPYELDDINHPQINLLHREPSFPRKTIATVPSMFSDPTIAIQNNNSDDDDRNSNKSPDNISKKKRKKKKKKSGTDNNFENRQSPPELTAKDTSKSSITQVKPSRQFESHNNLWQASQAAETSRFDNRVNFMHPAAAIPGIGMLRPFINEIPEKPEVNNNTSKPEKKKKRTIKQFQAEKKAEEEREIKKREEMRTINSNMMYLPRDHTFDQTGLGFHTYSNPDNLYSRRIEAGKIPDKNQSKEIKKSQVKQKQDTAQHKQPDVADIDDKLLDELGVEIEEKPKKKSKKKSKNTLPKSGPGKNQVKKSDSLDSKKSSDKNNLPEVEFSVVEIDSDVDSNVTKSSHFSSPDSKKSLPEEKKSPVTASTSKSSIVSDNVNTKNSSTIEANTVISKPQNEKSTEDDFQPVLKKKDKKKEIKDVPAPVFIKKTYPSQERKINGIPSVPAATVDKIIQSMETEKSKTVTQKPLFATPLVPQNQAAQPSSSGVISWASKLKGNSKQVQFPKSSASSTVAVSTPPVSARTRNDSSMAYSTTATSQISETTNTDDDVEVIINHQEIEQVSRYSQGDTNVPVHLAPYIPGNGPTTFDSPETQINSKTSSPIQKISEKELDQSQSIGSEQTTPVNVEDFTEEEKNSSISGKSPERKRTESDNNSVTATLNEEPVKNEIPVREYPRAEVMQDPRLVPMQYPSNVVIGADGQSYIQSPVYNMNPVYMHPFIGSPVNNLIGNVMVPQMIPTQQGNFMIMDQQIQMQNNFAAQPLVTGPDEVQKVELEKENEFGISFIADLDDLEQPPQSKVLRSLNVHDLLGFFNNAVAQNSKSQHYETQVDFLQAEMNLIKSSRNLVNFNV